MYRSKPFLGNSYRIRHPCRQSAGMWEDWDQTPNRKIVNVLRSQHRICPFSAQATVCPRPVSAWALKSLHIFLGQGGIKILQHCRRLLVAQWAAFCKCTERQVLPCRIVHVAFSHFWSFLTLCLSFKHTLLWNQGRSFLRNLIAQTPAPGSLLSTTSQHKLQSQSRCLKIHTFSALMTPNLSPHTMTPQLSQLPFFFCIKIFSFSFPQPCWRLPLA